MALLEVYADVGCPFTHVGLAWVVERRRRLGREDLAVHVRSWPLELVNGRPLDPATVADHVRELRQQVAPDLFGGFDPAAFPTTTLPALALAASAYDRGLGVGESVSLALRHALFEEGRDVSDPDVLGEVARAHGLEAPAATRRRCAASGTRAGRAGSGARPISTAGPTTSSAHHSTSGATPRATCRSTARWNCSTLSSPTAWGSHRPRRPPERPAPRTYGHAAARAAACGRPDQRRATAG